ncbi:MAG: alkaline phosphatase family protein [Rikenellaceae bacterium]
MTRKTIFNIVASLLVTTTYGQTVEINEPRLVVNIVISGMRSVDIERYRDNYTQDGLRMLYDESLRYDNCQYSYQQTTTPVSLSTLATGAQPSTHGIAGYSWFDYVTNDQIDLINNPEVKNLEYTSPLGGYSAHNLFVPTISETLLADSPKSKAVSVALNPASAILMSGKSGTPFWFDQTTCKWSSSEYYISELPSWVSYYNSTESDLDRVKLDWTLSLPSILYVNSRYSAAPVNSTLYEAIKISRREEYKVRNEKSYQQIASRPIGNDVVVSFAKLAVISMKLGGDEHVDILNVCFDVARNIVEEYGPESIEAEDMYYKLDKQIASLIRFTDSQIGNENVLYIVTSDHGSSPSVSLEPSRFNSRQLEVILNGFLSARHGNANWVLGCINGAIYLNHNAIYQKGLSLSDMQSEAATFTLQLQGVSHAITSSALSSNYFGSGYAQKIQTGFYPRRSGDVVLNFMPNWIVSDNSKRSLSGSMYNYDRAVPLMIYSKNIAPLTVTRLIDPISIAPTIAHMVGVSEPAASEGEPLVELVIIKKERQDE